MCVCDPNLLTIISNEETFFSRNVVVLLACLSVYSAGSNICGELLNTIVCDSVLLTTIKHVLNMYSCILLFSLGRSVYVCMNYEDMFVKLFL